MTHQYVASWGPPNLDFFAFHRWAGFPYLLEHPKPTTERGGLETYRQLSALYTGALPSEVL